MQPKRWTSFRCLNAELAIPDASFNGMHGAQRIVISTFNHGDEMAVRVGREQLLPQPVPQERLITAASDLQNWAMFFTNKRCWLSGEHISRIPTFD